MPYYTQTGSPATNSAGQSAQIRSEFALIQSGFTAVAAAIVAATPTPVSLPTNVESTTNKDVSNGYPGLTLLKINIKNAANTFTNFLTNATTAARTWTFPDRSGNVSIDGPMVLAYATQAQVISAAVDTKIFFPNVSIDTGNNFVGGIYTPQVAGWYSVGANCGIDLPASGVINNTWIAIFKNGVRYVATGQMTGAYELSVSSIVYLNGTTDYISAYIRNDNYFYTNAPYNSSNVKFYTHYIRGV